MRSLKTTNNKIIIIDDVDFEKVNRQKWYGMVVDKCQYAVRYVNNKDGSRKAILMHRIILNIPFAYQVDHKNGNGLDNRRENLRMATHAENMSNRRMSKHNKSGFKGVYWKKSHQKWCATLRYMGKSKFLGYFDSKIEAVKIYDKFAEIYFKEFAKTNKTLGLV